MAAPSPEQGKSLESPASSGQASLSGSRDPTRLDHDDPVSVERLVEHLLAAKRSLSSMQHVLRANDLATHARQAHEEACILSAQTALLQQMITRQCNLLKRVRRSLKNTHNAGKRDFSSIVRTMDATNEKLEETISFLRDTPVERAFRPETEQPRSLMDFVDEQGVHRLVEALKKSLGDLQGIQTSFDGDLLRFDNDMRAVAKARTVKGASTTVSPSASTIDASTPDLLISIIEHAHSMAQLLSSLTQHFDLCVTAVRSTEGGADLARRMAAETTHSQEGDIISISGVMADQDSHSPNLEPTTSRDRADMLDVVVGDASEVEGVVYEITDRLRTVEEAFATLTERVNHSTKAHAAAINTLHMLEDIGGRLAGYMAAEAEFLQRWEDEHMTIYGKLDEMEALRVFYQGYAGAYDAVLLEAERRRVTEEKMSAIWRRAKEGIDKLVEADAREREAFRQDVAEFIPTDLWPGMDQPVQRWKLVPMDDEAGSNVAQAPAVGQHVIEAARERLEQRREYDDGRG